MKQGLAHKQANTITNVNGTPTFNLNFKFPQCYLAAHINNLPYPWFLCCLGVPVRTRVSVRFTTRKTNAKQNRMFKWTYIVRGTSECENYYIHRTGHIFAMFFSISFTLSFFALPSLSLTC